MSDFTNTIDVGVPFAEVELDEGVDFFPSGDEGVIVVSGGGFGEGGFGEGPFGGSVSYTLTHPTTEWVNIDTP